MGINFPNAPTLNQLWPQPAQPGVPVWRWDGQAWMAGSADSIAAVVLRSYLAGLTLSTSGGSTLFVVAPGVAVDSGNADMMTLANALTKSTSAWAVGNNNGALDTGTIAANTWYHVFLIKRPDTRVVDVLVSLSPTAPTLPANYTLFRRIGSMKTNASSQWTKFVQIGDKFLWDVVVADNNGGSTGGAVQFLQSVSVPPGMPITVQFYCYITSTAANAIVVFASPLTAVIAANSPAGHQAVMTNNIASGGAAGQFFIDTTTAQIQCASSVTLSLYVVTQGWIDRRGRDA